MSFVERQITVAIKLATNTQTNQPNKFSESGTDTVTLIGSRTSVRVTNSGSPVGGRAQVRIWGLTPSIMNQLATLGLVVNLVPRNTVTVSAGDKGGSPSVVFSGTIWASYGDYTSQPDVPFILECLSAGAEAVVPATASSFSGMTDVATIMSGIARQMNMGFENNGVSVQISNPYYSGSAREQARKCAEQAGINWGIDAKGLSIWPRGGNRNTPNVPVISPATGMVGYPAFTQQGIIVRTLFNPQISFGSLIRVESDLLTGLKAAQGAQNATSFPSQWAINKLDLALDAYVPKGDWMSTIYAYNPGYAKSIIPPP